MPTWNIYVEMMADPMFAILTALLSVGFIVFLFLAVKWVKAGSASAQATKGGGDNLVFSMGTPATVPATPPPTTAPTPTPPPPTAPPPTPAEKPKVVPVDLAKTVVLPPRETPPPSPGVDMGMYEALVRRISSIEAEVKKDPLFLDPLLKRINQLERKLEDIPALSEKINALTQQVAALASAPPPPPPPAGDTPAVGGVSPDEFHAFKEKVYGLQKILEHLAESPTPPSP